MVVCALSSGILQDDERKRTLHSMSRPLKRASRQHRIDTMCMQRWDYRPRRWRVVRTLPVRQIQARGRSRCLSGMSIGIDVSAGKYQCYRLSAFVRGREYRPRRRTVLPMSCWDFQALKRGG